MELSKHVEILKRNATAIITALIVFLLVVNYLIFIVPKNEEKIDQRNKNVLEEFGLQVNNTLKDYANKVDWNVLKAKFAEKNIDDTIGLDKYKDRIVIQSVLINSIENNNREISIIRKIKFKSDSAPSSSRDKLDSVLDKYRCNKTPFYLIDKITVDKIELTDRLKGGIIFKDWMIYMDDISKKVILNNNIDFQELDSIAGGSSRLGVYNFSFSGRRFYKKSFSVDGTNFRVILIGAVDQKEFEKKSRSIDVNVLSLCILLVILLFLCIPMLKPLISSSREKLTQWDLINATTCIGILTMVVAVFTFSSCLLNEYNGTLKKDLSGVHKKVQDSLNLELNEYKKALDLVTDGALSKTGFHIPLDSIRKPLDHIKQLNKLQSFVMYNKKGEVIKDISPNQSYPLRKNNRDRDYFKTLTNSDYHTMLTAVYTKKDNVRKLVYAKKKNADTLLSCVFAQNFTKTIKTDGITGYMFFHKVGRVILHSDSTKSLNESIYNSSYIDPHLVKLFHGMKDTCFEMNYNGDVCMFYGKQLPDTISEVPLYLLTYKSKRFSNDLKIYTVVNGFFISLAYALSIILLGLCYSVFFYLGNVRVLSTFHLTWLFPDNSREKEYTLISKVHYGLYGFLGIVFILYPEHLLYISILTGINIAFFAFVLLNLRLFSRSMINNKWFGLLIACIVVTGYLIPFILYHNNYPAFGLSMSLLGHGIYLYLLKRNSANRTLRWNNAENEIVSEKQKCRVKYQSARSSFIGFFSNVIGYHYLLVPCIVVLGLFESEIQKVNDYNYSVQEKQDSTTLLSQKDNVLDNSNRNFSDFIRFVHPPSESVLGLVDFDEYKHDSKEKVGLAEFTKRHNDPYPIFFLFFCLIALALSIKQLFNFYAGRFFFFDLSEACRKGLFTQKNEFANCCVIIPPYDENDLEALEKNERPLRDRNKELKQNKWLKDIEKNVISNEIKIDLIMIDNYRIYKSEYRQLWNSLSDDEKFVMLDFALDHFMNYKNKDILIQLMEKGLIVADSLTGRLRVMNQGFSNFVVRLMNTNPETIQEEENSQGTFSKWRLPIMIVACSALLLLMYLNKESFNQILFVGGSVVSAMGMIAKFLDSYKK